MERALILKQTIPNSSNICNNETGNENGKSDFIFNLLKNRIANLENEISKKDAIIDHLTNKLFNVSHNNKKNLQKDDDNNGKNSKSTHDKTSSQGNCERNDKKKVVVTTEIRYLTESMSVVYPNPIKRTYTILLVVQVKQV